MEFNNLISYQIPGLEGKAGMAAIYDEKATLDIDQLSIDLKEHLATYAIPRFIRIFSKIDLTGNLLLFVKFIICEYYF